MDATGERDEGTYDRADGERVVATVAPLAPSVAPVVPTAAAAARLRPIGLLRSTVAGGLWADRRRTNRDVTIPHGAAQLEKAGNLFNLALAAGIARGAYRADVDDSGGTAPFLDSDVHKWLEAVGWELAQRRDPSLLALADPVIGLVEKAQRGDGYVDSFFQAVHPGSEFTDFQWGHELYVAGHLVQAAIAWTRGVGDDRLLRVAERFVARIEAELGPGGRDVVCGHPEFEMSLVELYRLTGRAAYVDFARTLIDRRGHGLLGNSRFGARYWQDHEPVRTTREPAGHAVRQMYLDCGVVDVAVETGDDELLESAVRRWDAMVATRTYLTGGLGAHHRDEAFGDPFELPPDRAYAETCAAIGSVMLAWRLLLATGQTRFADLIERTAFNAVLSGVGFDGTHFFYSSPLMRRSGGAEVLEGAASTRRAEWFPIACCPPNLMRFLATFPDLVATVGADGVQVHQFAPGSIEAPVHGRSARIDVGTDYPWDGDVELVIATSPPEPWQLSLRVPHWCTRATLLLNGHEVASQGPGAATLQRAWLPGDTVLLRLEMPPRVTRPDPRIDALRSTVALERGPLVYAIEDADLPSGRSVESLEIDQVPPVHVITASEEQIGELRRLAVPVVLRDDPDPAAWPYGPVSPRSGEVAGSGEAARSTDGSDSPGTVAEIHAVPYFAWANRPGRGMRVWLPTRAGNSNTSRETDGAGGDQVAGSD